MAHVYNRQLDAYALYHQQQEFQVQEHSSTVGPALPALGHALAGSTGTAISNLALYPLNLIITRLQVQRQLRQTAGKPDDGEYSGVIDAAQKIYKNEGGLAALYSGVVQDTGKSIADSFLFFLFYNYLRTNRLRKHGANTTTLPALDELGVGALAGAFSKFFTAPISNIVTRKQTASMLATRSGSSYSEPTVSEIAQGIRDEKGVQGFWSGYSASLVLTLNPSLTFFLYETFKRTLLPRSRRDDPGARVTFLMAAVSKAIASTITYPFSLAKARSQAGSRPPVDEKDAEIVKVDVQAVANGDDRKTIGEKKEEGRKTGRDLKSAARRSTVFSTILEIYQNEGFSALYEGVLGEICKGFFSHGTTMLVKEAVHRIIIQLYFFLSKLLKKVPEQANEAYEGVKDQAGSLVERVQVMGVNATETVNTAGQYAQAQAGNLADGASEAAKSSSEYATSQAGNMLERAQNIGSTAGEAAASGADYTKSQASNIAERAQVIGSNASEAVASGAGQAKSQAGNILVSVQETVGKSVEDIGKTIRPANKEGKHE